MRRLTMPAALLLLLFFSCNQRGYRDSKSTTATPDAAPAPTLHNSNATTSGWASSASADSSTTSNLTDEARQFKSPAPGTPKKQPHIPTPQQPANPDWDRKIIKTADLSIETKNFSRFTERLHRLVHETGGYIAQEEQTQSALRIDNSISIKVPVDRFDDLLQQLPADSDQLADKKVTSQDVSLEVVDTRSRLETKKEVRERYIDLLKQAHKMEDIISLQQEIDGIQEEMDAAAGRVNYLTHAATFSTINLKFFQILDPNALNTPAPEPTFLHKIKLSLQAGWQYLSSVLLGLLTIWPLWLALGLGVAAWRRNQSRINKKPA